jgi:hypothetical protein
MDQLHVGQAEVTYAYLAGRRDDYYLALVGELFDRLRDGAATADDWAALGNAFAQMADAPAERLNALGVAAGEPALFGAAAFYCGGFPASAYLTIRNRLPPSDDDTVLACFDLLARPNDVRSQLVRGLLGALRRGQSEAIEAAAANAIYEAERALAIGPEAWISARLLQQLLARFRQTNLRAVLPDGNAAFWTPLVASFMNRQPSTWEFFPSQIAAIQRGFLDSEQSYSIQMPTGAGKTALCETLLFAHLKRNEGAAAVLLVPYRSLASELKNSLVRRLKGMSISARCAYGGTVPSGDEVRELDDAQAVIATPEALGGLFSADNAFFRRTSLVICDEGHLLDAPGRGVGLELLLARLRVREGGAPRFVFMSAIVPNIEEINAWLGGTPNSVVRSDYRPALAEFAVLEPRGKGANLAVGLKMHPHLPVPIQFVLGTFLRRDDFLWRNPTTGRPNTYAFSSVKTQAIATARKTLPLGAAAVFAANKRGAQGAVGLAEEFLEQVACGLQLPHPLAFANAQKVNAAAAYLDAEFGGEWVGTKMVTQGAVLHHGDVPQEAREVVESLLRHGDARFAICTSTLAEGVNLPIRTLVLYSVQRRRREGGAESMLTRDIKNLVGRAGRAGATTKGLVICANPQQWPAVQRVAQQAAGEPVAGALRQLLERLQRGLAAQNLVPTNALLEREPLLHTLVDGIDATLVELASEELGEAELIALATQIADETFAASQLDAAAKALLRQVFALRATRVVGIRAAGRIGWLRETGARARMIDAVEGGLLPLRGVWDDVTNPVDEALVRLVLEWAWTQPDLIAAVREGYRLGDTASPDSVRESFFLTVLDWIAGKRFRDLAVTSGLEMDDLLGAHTRVIGFALQTLVEQGVAILGKLLEASGRPIAPAVVQMPEHLRFGVPTLAALVLANGGVRHRTAAVEIGKALTLRGVTGTERMTTFVSARLALEANEAQWRPYLGELVFTNTLADIHSVVGESGAP